MTKATLYQAANAYGINLRRPKRGRPPCPFCGSKSAFSVSQSEAYFNCFRCGASGDVAAFIAKGLNTAIDEAVQLKKNLEFNADAFQVYKSEKQNRAYIRSVAFSCYQEAFRNSRQAQDYLRDRGFNRIVEEALDPPSLNSIEIGYAPSETYLREQGIPEEALRQVGLVNDYGREPMAGRAVFPIKNRFRDIVHFQGRAIGEANIPWLDTKHLPGEPPASDFLFNGEKLYADRETLAGKALFLCEGIGDCLAVLEVGLASVATLGNYIDLSPYDEALKQVGWVVAAFDNDCYAVGTHKAGEYKSWERMLPSLIALQRRTGINVRCFVPPESSGVKDMNDYLESIGFCRKTFQNALEAKTQPLPQFALNQYRSKPEFSRLKTLLSFIPQTGDTQAQQDLTGLIDDYCHCHNLSQLQFMNQLLQEEQ